MHHLSGSFSFLPTAATTELINAHAIFSTNMSEMCVWVIFMIYSTLLQATRLDERWCRSNALSSFVRRSPSSSSVRFYRGEGAVLFGHGRCNDGGGGDVSDNNESALVHVHINIGFGVIASSPLSGCRSDLLAYPPYFPANDVANPLGGLHIHTYIYKVYEV